MSDSVRDGLAGGKCDPVLAVLLASKILFRRYFRGGVSSERANDYSPLQDGRTWRPKITSPFDCKSIGSGRCDGASARRRDGALRRGGSFYSPRGENRCGRSRRRSSISDIGRGE